MRIQHFDDLLNGPRSHAIFLALVALILQSGCTAYSSLEKRVLKNETQKLNDDTNLPVVESGETDSAITSTEQLVSLGDTTLKPTQHPLDLMICKMKVSNAPLAVDRQISRRSATGCLNGVPLLIAPAPEACLTSGFGARGTRKHKGIDLQSKPAGDVVAAASGEVVINSFRQKDYGNWIVIDHGSDVFTFYAHLASTDPSITNGTKVTQGQKLGTMGKTGPKWITAVHLHYEIRHGKLKNKNYFGLTPADPFALPGSCPAS